MLNIILYIFLFALFLIAIILCIIINSRIKIEIKGKNDELEIGLLFFTKRIKVYSKTTKTKRKKKIPDKEEAEKDDEPEEKIRNKLTIDDMIKVVKELLLEFAHKIIFEVVFVNLKIATDDAAVTGQTLGGAFAIAGMSNAFLQENFKVENIRIIIDADFDKIETEYAFVFLLAIIPRDAFFVAIKKRKFINQVYRKLKLKGE